MVSVYLSGRQENSPILAQLFRDIALLHFAEFGPRYGALFWK